MQGCAQRAGGRALVTSTQVSNARSLRAFARHGLHQLDSGRPRKIVLGRHVASLLHHKLSESRLLAPIAGLTKLIPPGLRIPYPPLDLKWALFRKEAA